MSCRRPIALAVALLAALACAPAALASDASYEGMSDDGAVVIFSTTESLVPGDTDIRRDIYERHFDADAGAPVTRLVSIGPSGGNDGIDAFYYGASADGSRVFFVTAERLTPDDKDNVADIYMRDLTTQTTQRVSVAAAACAASNCGNANLPVGAVTDGVLPGGEGVFFTTAERLAPADTDSAQDVYLHRLDGGGTTLVTRGASDCAPGCGNGAVPASFGAASDDGARVAFTTTEPLAPGDGGASLDIYLRDLDAGTTERVTPPTECPNCDPIFKAIAADGDRVYFESRAQLDAVADTDSAQDIYAWSDEGVERVSFGPAGGNADQTVVFGQLAGDRDAVFFLTAEQLTGNDGDSSVDIYVRDLEAGTTTLVSRAAGSCGGCAEGAPVILPPDGVPPSGPRVFFLSTDRMAAEDEDSSFDVYVRDLDAGTTTLVSHGDPACAPTCGNGDFDANFAGAAADGSRAFVVTLESLIPADADAVADIYGNVGGAVELVSTGPAPGLVAHGSDLFGVSAAGTHAVFVTRQRLTLDDLDSADDVYMRADGETLLVSRRNDEEVEEVLAPPAPKLTVTDPHLSGEARAIRVFGNAQAGSAVKVYLGSASCSGEPVATGSAEQLGGEGIEVTVPHGSNSELRATAEAQGFISTCSGPLFYMHVPPPDPGGGGGGGGGPSTGGGGLGGGSGGAADGPGIGAGAAAFLTPKTRITFAPAAKTRVRRPVFRFTDSNNERGSRFRCKVDRQRWVSCGSPLRLKRLRPGRHVFRVRAVNAAGEWERRPVNRVFRLVGGRR